MARITPFSAIPSMSKKVLFIGVVVLFLCVRGGTSSPFEEKEEASFDIGAMLGEVLGQLNGGDGGGGGGGAFSCPSLCEGDQIEVPRADYPMKANGCSVPDFIQVDPRFDFNDCCNRHDVCYASCGIEKERCEEEFGECMKLNCITKHRQSESANPECESQADLFLAGVKMFGCKSFQETRASACTCMDKEEGKSAFIQLLERKMMAAYKVVTEAKAPRTVELMLENFEGPAHALYELYKERTEQLVDIVGRDGKVFDSTATGGEGKEKRRKKVKGSKRGKKRKKTEKERAERKATREKRRIEREQSQRERDTASASEKSGDGDDEEL